jgi:glutaminase
MKQTLQQVLDEAVLLARENQEGRVADYIPELASVNQEELALSIRTLDGEFYSAGDSLDHGVTLQSTAKLVLLIGMLEEFGAEQVFSWVRVEPSGNDFNSVARLDQFGPYPSNPMVNAGAIALCDHIPGQAEEQLAWLSKWMQICFNEKLYVDPTVFASERRTGHRNRSLAYLLKSNAMLSHTVDEVLEAYFCLCSFVTSVNQASYLPMLLANGGVNLTGERLISHQTVQDTLAIMATCGMYNESGTHLVKTGMPAKSGVSGFILASAMNKAGVSVYSPRVNAKGTSVRGAIILEHLSKKLKWHFVNQSLESKEAIHHVDCC